MAIINLSGSINTTGIPILGYFNVVFTSGDNTAGFHVMTSTEYTNQYLNVTGALTQDCNLLVPLPGTVGQQFIIKNNTSGSHSITIKVNSMSYSGVTIPNGYTYAVVCDTTLNFIQTGGNAGNFTAGGDLSGTSTSQEVIGIYGFPISPAPSSGEFLVYNGSTWVPQTAPGGSFSAGGDLSGSDTNQTVIGIQSVAISATAPRDGYILTATGISNAAWQPPSAIFTAAGDLAGTATDQEVVGLLNSALPSYSGVTNTNGYLNWNGSGWVYSNPSGAVTLGGDVTGGASSNTVTKIQHISISNAAILDGYVLTAQGPSNAAFMPFPVVLNGDLGGLLTSQTVIGLYNVPLSNATPTANQVLQFESGTGKWTPETLALGNDLSGSFGDAKVVGFYNYPMIDPNMQYGSLTTAQDGYVWSWNGHIGFWEVLPPSGGVIFSDDLEGTDLSQTVIGLYGKPLGTGMLAPMTGNIIVWDGTYWNPSAIDLTSSSAVAGRLSVNLNLAGGTVGQALVTNNSNDPAWVTIYGDITLGYAGNVIVQGLQTIAIDPTPPSFDASFLIYNGGSNKYFSQKLSGAVTMDHGGVTTIAHGTAGQVLMTNSTPATTWISISNDITLSSSGSAAVVQITGPGGGGNASTVPILANYLSFDSGLSGSPLGGPVIEQTADGYTSSITGAAGAALSIYPQTGQQSTDPSGTGGAGGFLNLFAGLGGAGGSADGSPGEIWIGDQSNITGIYVLPDFSEVELKAPTEIAFYINNSLTIDVTTLVTINAGLQLQITNVTTTPYTVDSGSATDYTLFVNVGSAASITLPAATIGRTLVIKDSSGSGGAHHITITPASGTIDGAASYVLTHNWASIILTSDGTDWFVVADTDGSIV